MQNRVLVTGVGGKVGGIGLKVAKNLAARGFAVRALLHTQDSQTESELKAIGTELVFGDLTELEDTHRAIQGCNRIYFGLGISSRYLEAAINTAVVAKHYGVECFVNLSQMTVSQMSIHETTESTQQKFHWLTEQVLSWSGMPIVTIRSTVLLENPFFFQGAAESISKSSEIRLPFAPTVRTSPIASADVARVATEILVDPKGHIGKVYELTGHKSESMLEITREYSAAMGHEIRYVEVPLDIWKTELSKQSFPEHLTKHILTMVSLHRMGRYDRQTYDVKKVTGKESLSIRQWVESNREEFPMKSAA